MQEAPPQLSAILLAGPADELGITRSNPLPTDPLGSLLTGEAERVLVIHGITANLYAYLAPGETEAWVRRVAVGKEDRTTTKPKGPTLSRRERAAAAGKRKVVKRSPQRRRR